MLDEATRIIGPMINASRFATGDEPDRIDEAGTEVEPTRHSFDGTHFRVADASNLPPPRFGSMPLWIGGIGEKRTLPMAARYADGWNAAYVSPEDFQHKCSVLDAACDAVGREPSDIERSVNLAFAMGSDRVRADAVAAALPDQWGPLTERMAGGTLTGTPEEAVDKVMAYVEAGADMVNIALRAPFEPEALAAYHEVVMPAVRAAG
jgi:alkanesulfonate monooxygenase SsuD/methylene tetrahydromethanopterin reductase-like flavin-dependent oxidoreductase (luciferase family)